MQNHSLSNLLPMHEDGHKQFNYIHGKCVCAYNYILSHFQKGCFDFCLTSHTLRNKIHSEIVFIIFSLCEERKMNKHLTYIMKNGQMYGMNLVSKSGIISLSWDVWYFTSASSHLLATSYHIKLRSTKDIMGCNGA